MEISLPKLIANWKIPLIGTLVQILVSVVVVGIVGYYLNWPINRIVVIGFVISLSSSAIVFNYLENQEIIDSKVGQNVIGILLIQDILVVPMLIIINYMSGVQPEMIELIKQLIGGGLILGITLWVLIKKRIHLPFADRVRNDHEIQVFIAFTFCFGFALLTAFLGLSSALGAFVAGVLVASTKETIWVKKSLHSFRIVFVALFFVSVGVLIDLVFLMENLGTILLMVLSVLFTNNLINALIVRFLGETWRDSLYTGALLAQIGEFSFILGATAFITGLVTEYSYQLIISVISLTLIISPLWIFLMRKIVKQST